MKMLDISLYLLEKYVYETVVSHNAYYFRVDLEFSYEQLVHTYKDFRVLNHGLKSGRKTR